MPCTKWVLSKHSVNQLVETDPERYSNLLEATQPALSHSQDGWSGPPARVPVSLCHCAMPLASCGAQGLEGPGTGGY